MLQELWKYVLLVPLAVFTGLVGWFGNAYLERQRLASANHKADIENDTTLEKHRDSLTFQLLDAARIELGAMRTEVEKLRPMELHLYHLQQALDHIDALLNPDADRASAERNARAFLNRMRRLDDARGAIINEVQRVSSAIDLGQDPNRG